MPARLRIAVRSDIPAIQRIRRTVRENRLTTSVVTDADVEEALERTGRGWVMEVDGGIAGFSIATRETGNIWALFVAPDHEGRGHGQALLREAVAWLWRRSHERIWLSTEPGTRAAGFYAALGWRHAGLTDTGEIRFELTRPA